MLNRKNVEKYIIYSLKSAPQTQIRFLIPLFKIGGMVGFIVFKGIPSLMFSIYKYK